MPSKTAEELRDFHRFLGDKLSSDGIELSPEEVLDEWRRLHPRTQTFEEDVAAIQEALDDMAKGDLGCFKTKKSPYFGCVRVPELIWVPVRQIWGWGANDRIVLSICLLYASL